MNSTGLKLLRQPDIKSSGHLSQCQSASSCCKFCAALRRIHTARPLAMSCPAPVSLLAFSFSPGSERGMLIWPAPMPALWTHHQTPTQTHWVPGPPVAASRPAASRQALRAIRDPTRFSGRVCSSIPHSVPWILLSARQRVACLPLPATQLEPPPLLTPAGPSPPIRRPFCRRVAVSSCRHARPPAARPGRPDTGRAAAGRAGLLTLFSLERTYHAVLDTTDECPKGRNSCLVLI